MKLKITKDWLTRRLKHADDTQAGAGGTSFDQLKKDVESRMVTPNVLAVAPTQVGKVVRYIREQRGWSVQDLATIASVDEAEITSLETQLYYSLTPRAVIYLADALGFSRERFKELVGFVVAGDVSSPYGEQLRFAAKSASVKSLSKTEFETIRALVEVLSDKKIEG